MIKKSFFNLKIYIIIVIFKEVQGCNVKFVNNMIMILWIVLQYFIFVIKINIYTGTIVKMDIKKGKGI